MERKQKVLRERNMANAMKARNLELPFIESFLDTEEYVHRKGHGKAQDVVRKITECLEFYEVSRLHLVAKSESLKRSQDHVEDCEEALKLVKHWYKKNQNTNYHCKLREDVYAPMVFRPGGTICLSIGAKVFVEYSLKEGKRVLSKRKKKIIHEQKLTKRDLFFVIEQQAVMMLSIARVHNWDVFRIGKEHDKNVGHT